MTKEFTVINKENTVQTDGFLLCAPAIEIFPEFASKKSLVSASTTRRTGYKTVRFVRGGEEYSIPYASVSGGRMHQIIVFSFEFILDLFGLPYSTQNLTLWVKVTPVE